MLAVSAILKRLTAALAAVSLDPYFNNVSLLLTGNGLSGLGNKTFIDSASGLAVSVGAGQPTQGSFNPFNSNYAATFNGSSDWLALAANNNFLLGTGIFTIEFWVMPTVSTGAYGTVGMMGIGGASNGSLEVYFVKSTQQTRFNIYGVGASDIYSTGTLPYNVWSHVAYVREGTGTNQFKIYINGKLDKTSTLSDDLNKNTPTIGRPYSDTNNIEHFGGSISNLRIVKGYALYTSNFTPQAILSNSPLGVPLSAVSVLTLQNGAFVDLSTNNTTITANGTPKMEMITTALSSASLTTVNYPPSYDSTLHNSVLFDGSSYVYTGTNTNLQLGTSQFTVECWFYRLGDGSNAATFESILDFRTTDNNTLAFAIGTKNTGQVNTYAIPSGATNTDRGAFALNGWNHLAVVNDGTNFRFFINGIQTQTASVGSTNYTQGGITIGRTNTGVTGAFSFNGYVSNVRVIKGSALYTSNFTPSVSGLTSTAQTSLLACQDSTIRDNSSNNLSLSTFGNPTVTTTNPFGVKYSDYKGGFYGGSGYFDGSSYISSSSAPDLTSADFTLEGWCYFDGTPDPTKYMNIFKWGTTGNDGWAVTTYSGNITLYRDGTPSMSVAHPPANTWFHLALTRSNRTNFNFWINGVTTGATSITTNSNAIVSPKFLLGVSADGLANVIRYKGYISNFRASLMPLYTSNFAPPAAPVRPTGNTSLLLNFANAGIYDITRKNNLIQYGTASVSTSASKFGGGSMYFNGSSYLTSLGSQLTLGTGNWTIECWFYDTTGGTALKGLCSLGTTGTGDIRFGLYNAKLYVNIYGVSDTNSTTTISANRWYHVAIVRNGSTIIAYINGVQDGTQTAAAHTATSLLIGAIENSYNWTGFIDDLRITKGVARYTSNFSVPTRELPNSNITLPDGDIYFNNVSLLLNGNGLSDAQNNTFLDSSVNNLTVTRNGTVTQGSFSPFSTLGNVYNLGVNGGSGYFDGVDGSWCYVTQPAIGVSENYTMEFWVYLNAFKSPGAPRITQDNDDKNTFYLGSGTGVLRYSGGGVDVSVGTLELNKWYHIAVSRQSDTLRLFMNGQLMSTGSGSTALNNVRLGLMGAAAGGAASINGYMSNFRFVKGLAVYTATFTPPTSPVTLVSNGGATPSTAPTATQTSLLLNFTNGGIVDAVGKNNLVTVGNVRVDTATKKYGTGSMYFDGSGDYLTIPSTSQYNFGTGDWTVEFWVYPLAYGGTIVGGQLFGTTNGAQTGYSINLGQDINSFRVISNASGAWADDLSVGTGNGPSLNTWTYFAVVRSGGTLNIYKNGIVVATKTGITTYNYSGTTAVIGRFSESINTRDFNGYIDDLRVTKGVARYTSNFTAPTAPLPIEDV